MTALFKIHDSERIWKISQYLAKMWTRVLSFLRLTVNININSITVKQVKHHKMLKPADLELTKC